METYRSGHNGTDSKSVVPPGTVGSNPTVSAKKGNAQKGVFLFLYFLFHSVYVTINVYYL